MFSTATRTPRSVGHVRQRLVQPAAVGRLPAVGRVHDDERRPDAERELDRPVDLAEGVAAPHPAGHQEERRVHRQDGQRVVLGQRPDPCRVLRVGVVRHHQLDPVEPGPREQRERGVDRLGEDRDRRADDRRSVVGHAAMLTAVSSATAMLRGHVRLPLTAALVATLFAAALVRRYVGSRRPYELVWALALLMYAGASLAVTFGVANGWTSGEFRVYWALGAVLNVPFLAAGELDLLVHRRGVRWTLYVVLAFLTAYTVAVVRTAEFDAAALAQDLPSGKEVFGDGTAAHRLPQLVAIPAYLVLLGGTLWSAWRMRGRPSSATGSGGRC